MQCLDDNAVSEFVSGSLPPSAVTKVEGHLAGCRDCRALVAALARDAANDSNVVTVPHEKVSPSQVTELPRRILSVGDRVGRYLVLSTLGTGGMGVVFAAYDPQLDRKVALKLLRSGKQHNSRDAQQRLRREAQAIAQLSHPNVVGVYDVGTTDDGDLYIAMEFVEGDTLTTWLKRWPRTWREIIEVFVQAGRGLVAAHSVGLLHRDFKPDNVLVGGDGRVRVTDFGLARSLMIDDEAARAPGGRPTTALNAALTATGTVLGTPRYMPPEQLLGPHIDARSDQFSFCVALHEALYGEHPLPGATSVSMLEQGDEAMPAPTGTRVPSSVVRAIARGLERDPIKRFPTMAALINQLVPPAATVSPRFVIGALAGVVLLGGAAAAIFAGTDRAAAPVHDPNETYIFVEEINQIRGQLQRLERDRDRLLQELENRPTPEEVAKLVGELKQKDTQIQQLITNLQKQGPIRKPPPAKPSQDTEVEQATFQVELDGCFGEWAPRRDELGRPHDEAEVLVRMVVNPDGVGHSARATGVESESLKLCIEAAFNRVSYPTGAEQLDLEVVVSRSNALPEPVLTARVVGHRRPAPQLLEVN
ncbi:MAG: protein kinase [Kofleriaceae bacterium]